jgi:hypothetical protein
MRTAGIYDRSWRGWYRETGAEVVSSSVSYEAHDVAHLARKLEKLLTGEPHELAHKLRQRIESLAYRVAEVEKERDELAARRR